LLLPEKSRFGRRVYEESFTDLLEGCDNNPRALLFLVINGQDRGGCQTAMFFQVSQTLISPELERTRSCRDQLKKTACYEDRGAIFSRGGVMLETLVCGI
jgi:hypothetical protein